MTPTIQPKQPETLGQFLLLLGRGFLSGLKWKLLLAAIVTFLSWIFHTYLLVVVNEGFNAGTNPTLDLILALSDRLPSAVLVWTLFTALVTALFWRMIRVGVGPTLRAIFGTPGWLQTAFRRAGLMSLGLLFVGSMMVGLLVATILNQRLLNLQLALLGSGILVVRESSLLFIALSLGWSDLQRLTGRKSPTVLNLYGVGLVVCGATLGFWLAVVLPFYPYAHGALIVLLLLGMIALLVGGVFRPGHLLLLILFLTLAFAATPALADDGGWSESGGTLSGWLTSEGAVRAIAQGLFPAMGAGLGVLLGAMASSATSGLAGSPLSSGLSGRSVPAGKMSKSSEPATATPHPELHQRHRPEPGLHSSQKAPPEQPAIASHEQAGVSASQKGEQTLIARHEQAGVSASQKGEQPVIARHEQAGVSASQKGEQPVIASHEQAGVSASQKGEQPVIARHEQAGVSASQKGEQPVIARHEQAGVSASQKGEQPIIARHEQAGVSASQKGNEPPQTLITRHETSPSAAQKAETPAMAEQSATPPTPHQRAKPAEPSPAEQMEEILHGDQPPASSSPASQASHDPAGANQAKIVAPERTGQEQGTVGTAGRYGEGQSPHAQPPAPPPASQTSQPQIGSPAKVAVEPELSGASQASRPGEMATGTGKGASQTSQPQIGSPAKVAVEPELSGASQASRPGEMVAGASKGNEVDKNIRPGEMSMEPTKASPESPPTLVGGLPVIPAAFHWQITMTAGYAIGQSFPLAEVTIIGRGRDCDIQLLDPKASRQHAQIQQQGPHCQISDLNSRNGTHVNGRRINEPTLLRDGDLVRIGDTQFKLALTG